MSRFRHVPKRPAGLRYVTRTGALSPFDLAILDMWNPTCVNLNGGSTCWLR